MPYEKEYIEKADKAGVFVDSPIDAQVLETEETERMRMKKELEKLSKNKKENNVGENADKSKNKKRDIKKECEKLKRKIKLNLLDKIIYWLKGLFGGVHSQYRFLTKKELKKAKNIIQNFVPLFYDFRDPNSVKPRITREFAKTIYSIYLTFLKIYTFFEDAVKDDEELNINSESFFLKYETELISDSAKNILDRLTKDKIYELFAHHENGFVTIEKELSNFRTEVEAKDYKNLEIYSETFEVILILRKLDFKSFFLLFDKNFVDSVRYKPQINGNIYVNELKDCDNFLRDFDMFICTLASVNLPENVAIHFDSIAESIDINKSALKDEEELYSVDDMNQYGQNPKEKNGSTKLNNNDEKYSNINITSRNIREFLKNIKILVKSKIISSMVKYIHQDPLYTSKTIPYSNSFFDKYLSLTSYKIIEMANQSQKIIKDKNLKENIRSLFNVEDENDVNIAYVENYTPIMNKRLIEKKLSEFEHYKAIALIKMFFEQHYFRYIRELIDKLVVEGEYADKVVGQKFSDNIYNLEEDYKKLQVFEQNMKDAESIKILFRGINSASALDASHRNVLINKVAEINLKAKNILEEALPKLFDIHKILNQAINDSKTKNPLFVYNIKQISGLSNRAYINQLTNVSTNINQFLSIMKNFHLVTSRNLKKKFA